MEKDGRSLVALEGVFPRQPGQARVGLAHEAHRGQHAAPVEAQLERGADVQKERDDEQDGQEVVHGRHWLPCLGLPCPGASDGPAGPGVGGSL